MISDSSFKKSMIVRGPNATLCLPLVQVNAKGVLFLRHDSPFYYSLRIFRFGALIFSKTSTDLSSCFEFDPLRFAEIPQNLVFDVVVAGYFTPLKHLLVFPLYLHISWKRYLDFYQMILPGDKRDNWKANLSAGIKLFALRERRGFRKKTDSMSQISTNFSGGSYGSGS